MVFRGDKKIKSYRSKLDADNHAKRLNDRRPRRTKEQLKKDRDDIVELLKSEDALMPEAIAYRLKRQQETVMSYLN